MESLPPATEWKKVIFSVVCACQIQQDSHCFWSEVLCSFKQECIPVGCVPSAALAVPGGLPRVGGLPRAGCRPEGGCLPAWRSVSVCQGVCLPRGVHLPRGVCLPRGDVCLPRWGVSARHPPVNRITDSCKNITLPPLCCGR